VGERAALCAALRAGGRNDRRRRAGYPAGARATRSCHPQTSRSVVMDSPALENAAAGGKTDLLMSIKRVCVFCGSSPGARPAYAAAAAALAQCLVARGLTIVYGGGNVGLMGILADTARAAGGEVIGVI